MLHGTTVKSDRVQRLGSKGDTIPNPRTAAIVMLSLYLPGQISTHRLAR
jgi:hypothetical protein